MKQVQQQKKTATRQVRRLKLKETYPVFFHQYKQFLTRINPRLLQFGYALRIDLHTVKKTHSSAGIAMKFRLYRRTDEIVSRVQQKPLPDRLRQFFSAQKYTRVNSGQQDSARSYLSDSLQTLWHRLKHLEPMECPRRSLNRLPVCVSRVPSVDAFPHLAHSMQRVHTKVCTIKKHRCLAQEECVSNQKVSERGCTDEQLAVEGLCALSQPVL